MDKEKALNTITQALNVANQKGVFTLTDSATIVEALHILNQTVKQVKTLQQELDALNEPKQLIEQVDLK